MSSVRIENHRDEVEQAMNLALERALEGVGVIVEREAKKEIRGDYGEPERIDTGNLRNSITHQVVDSEEAVYVGTNVEYGIYVHEGTVRMAPNRFLKNAVERNADQIKEYIEDALKNGQKWLVF